MITVILLFLPLLSSLVLLGVKGEQVKKAAFGFALLELVFAVAAACRFNPEGGMQFLVNTPWVSSLGIQFKVGMDGISLLLVLLTAFLTPLIILASFRHTYKNPQAFYSLILLMQTGLIGVFVSLDAFLFYVAWEAALIPVYFISGIWGGENRIKVTLKFFIYTILGSLFMLIGIIYLYLQTPGAHSFDIDVFYALNLDPSVQSYIFWAFFIAFAIKMPIFPFHTWQPDTYAEAPMPGTMLLSGIMLKMGIYGVIRWILPVVPAGVAEWGFVVIVLSVIGIVYASVIAFTQQDMKRLIAYSSIAHVGLISAGIFSGTLQGLQGGIIQMVNHGLNVVGLFFIADIISSRTTTRQLSQLGGIAHSAPRLAVYFMIILLGSVALPLTNGFVGEFLLLMGIYKYDAFIALLAGLTIIFGAVYMFRFYQRTMLGEANILTAGVEDLYFSEKAVLFSIALLVIVLGVYPQPVLEISKGAAEQILGLTNQLSLIK